MHAGLAEYPRCSFITRAYAGSRIAICNRDFLIYHTLQSFATKCLCVCAFFARLAACVVGLAVGKATRYEIEIILLCDKIQFPAQFSRSIPGVRAGSGVRSRSVVRNVVAHLLPQPRNGNQQIARKNATTRQDFPGTTQNDINTIHPARLKMMMMMMMVPVPAWCLCVSFLVVMGPPRTPGKWTESPGFPYGARPFPLTRAQAYQMMDPST